MRHNSELCINLGEVGGQISDGRHIRMACRKNDGPYNESMNRYDTIYEYEGEHLFFIGQTTECLCMFSQFIH